MTLPSWLSSPPDLWPSDWRELFEERAAIREFDGGFTRAEAERLAREDVRERVDRGERR